MQSPTGHTFHSLVIELKNNVKIFFFSSNLCVLIFQMATKELGCKYLLNCLDLSTFFFFFWPCWVFVSVRGLSLVAARGGHSSSRCAGLSLSWPLLLQSTGSRRAGSVIVAHGPSCSVACGIFPDQGSNTCPLHWQADSQPLRHQGSPETLILSLNLYSLIK